ncbi:type IV secretion system protein [Rhodanobacter glycinis]|uniref:Type IV secretion system protein n=1 Tax=Rhodanobacter glycinis TaxID=582702 RepID=A0A502CGM4_9GAMM|nr:TrbC/VirB2 family protein [Rhodanobacter glycinis]TPG11790.1 type IV secretion system protein [Rhodanobacter glycinis]TPG47356.1 type IV secretion system protein [Rhodanobacter glycinis]
MAIHSLSNESILHSQRMRLFMIMCIMAFVVLPGLAFAQDAGATIDTTCGFASNVQKILNALSIVVVTIAVIFSGYQIAFAHKRIGDVAPVMIGAILIGAAGQIANMFLKPSAGTDACKATTSLITHVITNYV